MRIPAVVLLSLLLPQEPPKPDPVAFQAALIDAAVSRVPGFSRDVVAPACDDGEFLRRVMLDLVGYPPNAGELRDFEKDPAPDKRSAKVSQLLATDRFADFWARRWRDVLIGDYRTTPVEPLKSADPAERERLMESFRDWLASRIAADRPWSDTVREILEAEGDVLASPAIAYKLAHHGEPRVPYFEGQATRHFMALNLSCTGCHDAPFDRWRVEDGYAMGAFSNGRAIVRGRGTWIVTEGPEPAGRPIPGDRGIVPQLLPKPVPLPPRFITGGNPAPGEALAKAFARLVTDPANVRFRQSSVNRVWSWLMGRALFPLDDLNLKNKAMSTDLLRVLVDGFSGNAHSLKFLIHSICATSAYQRVCAGQRTIAKIVWDRTPVRPLSAEQLLSSIEVAALGTPRHDLESARRLARRLVARDLPACETIAGTPQAEGLVWLSESEEVWSLIREGPVLQGIRKAGPDPVARTRSMFLSALSREPGASELERYAGFLRLHGEDGLAQAYWTLLQTSEFLMRH